jgi:hypothetical protein
VLGNRTACPLGKAVRFSFFAFPRHGNNNDVCHSFDQWNFLKMEIFKKILDIVALVWIVVAYIFMLSFSIFLFDSPSATQFGAWSLFIPTTLIFALIPLIWSGMRWYYGAWFIRVKRRKFYAIVIALLWLITPFIFWNF